jgi:hypothetical protein
MPYKIAGIDVHKKVLMVVVIDAATPEEKPERRLVTPCRARWVDSRSGYHQEAVMRLAEVPGLGVDSA